MSLRGAERRSNLLRIVAKKIATLPSVARNDKKDVLSLYGYSGFTLIELIVVIALIAVFFSFAIPKLGDITESDLRRNIRHLTGTISYLRDEAMMKKREFRLNYNIAMNEYWATELVKSGTQIESKKVESVFVNKSKLHGDIKFKDIAVSGHQGSVEEFFTQFYPNGWVEKTVIHLQKGDDKYFTLIVMPLTGKVKVYEGYIEEQ